ncbi:putative leucine-rich repeat receptor-like serine/threonine-protein kinase [Nymphaea thermarum]|nr:putative leucine-rich repeat receptor-like serine/threonine-protein kinase [Nymphaea thermarum]
MPAPASNLEAKQQTPASLLIPAWCRTIRIPSMRPPRLFLFLSVLWPLITLPLGAVPAPIGFLIDCGASEETKVGDITWAPDDGFINTGNKTTFDAPGLLPTLKSLRFFPDTSARKYCYLLPVVRGGKYLVRTTYYYGNFDGRGRPPVFDQIIDGTRWSVVNTTVDYSRGLSTFYEIIIAATGKTMSVCLARNDQTVSSPFISALEVGYLETSLYNSTDFSKYALTTVARHNFGQSGNIVRNKKPVLDLCYSYHSLQTSFPDDPFNRYWVPFTDSHPAITSKSNVSVLEFWNKPPALVFETALSTKQSSDVLHLQWPEAYLPSSNYYIALYFQDNRAPAPNHWRSFSISINDKNFYSNLNVSTSGLVVYANNWSLSGLTQIKLTPTPESTFGPVLNAGEVLQIRLLGGRTVTRDVVAMQELARALDNPPFDWSGDPCLPHGNSWTGVSCTEGDIVRVISLNLTNFGISGSLPSKIADLTALNHILLGNNKLSGPIPEISSLKELISLHLENNQFDGQIPSSVGDLVNLSELFLQNNNLTGSIPKSLLSKTGLDIQLSPGNHFDGM